jgi:hypothetical protein
MTKIFDTLVNELIVESDIPDKAIRLHSPRPSVYTIFRLPNKIFMRVYHSGVIQYSKDKEGEIKHNLDGPALVMPGPRDVYAYYIDGVQYLKSEWEVRRHLNNQGDFEKTKDMLDL